jgi:hypothetical protein
MNNHDYPWGADNDSAPWNQSDPDYKECHKCNGCGKVCSYCGKPEGEDCECLHEDLPEDPEHYQNCHECDGEGEIPMENDDYYDPSDDR